MCFMSNQGINVKENDIIIDSYFLIKLFHDDGKEVTQIHVQKLMYLFEGYYMNVKDVNELYECSYQAWNLGPVASQLYNTFKKYGKNDIVLTEEEILKTEDIVEEKKKLLKDIYDAFKNFTTTDLIKFTHAVGSPWDVAWRYKEYSEINKEQLKEWFSKYIVDE